MKSGDALDLDVSDLIVPHGNKIVWRYMGMDQFIDLIMKKRLYFVNGTNLTDKYEISIHQEAIDNARKKLKENGASDSEINHKKRILNLKNKPSKAITYVNCWTISREESYALWKIYLDGAKAGVAIKSTVSNLKNSIINNKSNSKKLYMGKVKYGDISNPNDLNRINIITTKKKYYEYENELRLFFLEDPEINSNKKFFKNGMLKIDLDSGKYLSVDIKTLIDEIYVSPFCDKWFFNSFKSLVKEIVPKLSEKVVNSSIKDS